MFKAKVRAAMVPVNRPVVGCDGQNGTLVVNRNRGYSGWGEELFLFNYGY